MIRGVRGATTVKENKEDEILDATEKLFRTMVMANKINAKEVASVFISVTEDITATFPAKAMRRLTGWGHVPVMCMREIPVPGALEKCVRIMMHVNTSMPQDEITHIYLEEAVALRPDLVKNANEV